MIRASLAGLAAPHLCDFLVSHPGITSRTAADTALVLEVLAKNGNFKSSRYSDVIGQRTGTGVGVASNFHSDREVSDAFVQAVELLRGLGYPTLSVAAPLRIPHNDLSRIESDRKRIAAEVFPI